MQATETEKRDWSVIALILLFGLLGTVLAGGWALRFAPRWELDASLESRLDPNSDFLTRRPGAFIEPVDPAILTNPAWVEVFLTPGATFSPGRTQVPATQEISSITQASGTLVTTLTAPATTTVLVTNTPAVSPGPTNTFVFFPPAPTSTKKPNPIDTSTPVPTSSETPTQTATGFATFTSTPTASAAASQTSTATATLSTLATTPTASATPTATATPSQTATSTPTDTPDPSEPDFGGPDGNTILLGNGAWIEFNLSGFLVDGDPAWDMVYYEKEEASSAGKIHLGQILIEVYDETTASWYTVYYWGDGNADTNASYSNGNSEPDAFPVDMGLLSGAPPLNTGIAIDIDSAAITQGAAIGDSITRIRITSLSVNDCDIDALQMLR
jgi:hypothetical protein